MGPVLYCGDTHGSFDHIIEAAVTETLRPWYCSAIWSPNAPCTRNSIRSVRVWWIPGNHDADSDDLWIRVWGSGLADRNVHGRIATLRDGTRLAGLGGIFREAVWHPSPGADRSWQPAFRSRGEHATSTPPHERWRRGHARKH